MITSGWTKSHPIFTHPNGIYPKNRALGVVLWDWWLQIVALGRCHGQTFVSVLHHNRLVILVNPRPRDPIPNLAGSPLRPIPWRPSPKWAIFWVQKGIFKGQLAYWFLNNPIHPKKLNTPRNHGDGIFGDCSQIIHKSSSRGILGMGFGGWSQSLSNIRGMGWFFPTRRTMAWCSGCPLNG